MIDVDAFNQYMEQTLGFDSMFSMSFDSLIDIDNRTNRLDCIFNFTSANTITNTQPIRHPAEDSACVIISAIQVTPLGKAPSIVVYASSKNKEHSNKSRASESIIIIDHNQYPLVLLLVLLVNTFWDYGQTHEKPDKILDRIFIWLMQNKEKNLKEILRN